MVGVLALVEGSALRTDLGALVEQAVGIDHVVDDGALADLLALELPLGRQVVAVVVAEMVVGGDGERLDTGVDQELGEDGLELGLTRLQVITADEGLVTLGELNASRNESVLGTTVDERLTLEDGRNSEEGRRGDLGVRLLDGAEEGIGGVVDAGNDVAVTLGVGGPENDDAVQVVVLLELADVGTDVVEMRLLVLSRDEVVSTSLLVGSDEVGVVDGGEGRGEQSHVGLDLALEVVVEDLGALHGLVHRETRDVPTAESEIVGVDHGEDIADGNVNVLAGIVSTNAHGGGTEHRPDVVGLLDTILSSPSDVVAVGQDSGAQGSAVVASQADHQQSSVI